ncbi:MAG: hypothetical protein AB1807_02485 [Pseudomonadota bacterium]
MKNYYSFNSDISNITGQRNYCFLFKPPGILRDGDLADAIEQSARQVLAPDGIAIVCILDEVTSLLNDFKSLASLQQASNRLTTRISLSVCSIDKSGQILFQGAIRNSVKEDKYLLRSASKKIFSSGLKKLFSAPHVLETSPPGFAFVKPSGERSTRFLRPENALDEIENVQFLSFALLERIYAREVELQQPLEVIYVDTMAIASLAYALRELYCALYNARRPRVVSFHSHDGLSDVDFPVFGTSFCIISASSSMRLERLWLEKSRFHPSEVVTLLTMDTAVGAEKAIYALKVDSPKYRSSDSLRDIRIMGERFAPEELKPKKVLLRKDAHFVKDAEGFAKKFTGDTTLAIQGRGDLATAKTRPFYVNGMLLKENSSFKSYTQKVLEQRVPASVKAVVYQDDVASKALAEECSKKLQKILQAPEPLPLIPHHKIPDAAAAIDRNAALLIVAAVIGRGTKLLSISRDLRPLHVGARTYLVGAQVSDIQSQITALGRNLKYSSEGAAIDVATFASIAIGDTLQASYESDYDALISLPEETLNSELKKRLEEISGTSTGVIEDALLPTGALLDQKLILRPDFAYWNFDYSKQQNNTPAVIMTAAAMLQNARESTTLSNANRLGTEAFQQVVLDPENFARYNDGVIQAAILRAALPGELDYSSETESSRYMLDMLDKIFAQCERAQGEAAPEFALALRTGRLKLTNDDMNSLSKRNRQTLKGTSPMKIFLRALLGIDDTLGMEQLPENF